MLSGLRTLTLLCVFASLLVIASPGAAAWAENPGSPDPGDRTYAMVFSLSSPTTLAQDNEYLSWAIGDTNVHPPQPRLMCPSGKFIKSVWIKQNEWLARIKIYCAGANESFRAVGTKEQSEEAKQEVYAAQQGQPFGVGTPGPEAGGNGGSGAHAYSITCPESYLVDGITGLNTTVSRFYGQEHFAADPHFFCGSYRAPGAQVVSDSRFERSGDRWVSYDDMNSLFPDPGIQSRFHCPARWAATGLWYKLGGAKKDDFQTVGLICAPLPAPRPTSVVGRP